MIKRMLAAVMAVSALVLYCNPVCVGADDAFTDMGGGIWQSADEIPEECEINVIDCDDKKNARAVIPSSFDISTNPDTALYFPPIGNQGAINSCAGWSTTYYQFTYEVNRYRNIPTDETNIFSPSWTYNYINGGANNNVLITDAYSVLKHQGAMTLSDYPHMNSLSSYSYSWVDDEDKLIEALEYRVASTDLYTVDSSENISKIKSKIADGHIGVIWTNSSGWTSAQNSSGENFIVRGSNRGNVGHFMTLVGYDDDIEITVNGVTLTGAFKIANSMGKSWGNNGYVWVSYDALNYTSVHGNAWQNSCKGTRTAVFGKAEKNNFYFIDVKKCNVCFVGCVKYITNDPWDLVIKADPSAFSPTKRWGCDIGLPLANSEYRCLVFDYFDSAANKDLGKYMSRDWTVQITGDNSNPAYRISSRILDNLGNPIAPIDTVYGSLENGIYSRSDSINLAKGRVTSYDDDEITLADAELIMDYIEGKAEFSNVQKFLADYDNNGTVDIADVVLMKRCIAA
ncbi:MAG: hypothetical protein IKV85_04395 [Ruminococcus sp.]|nr:hypothetical protein [Ruminococcus sp.]